MPIRLGAKIQRLDQAEFGEIAYEVMRCAFRVHSELGRLFDEKIYQRALAFELVDARTEVPVEITFEQFSKTHYVDLLVAGGAMFELKAVDSLTSRHRGQLLNYLLLADAAHGKLINFRTERVEHEFVNSTLIRENRIAFAVDNHGWQKVGQTRLMDRMISLLRDWGTGLDIALYEEAASHLCGRAEVPCEEVEICAEGRNLGVQPVRVAAPGVALRVTAMPPDRLTAFEAHLQRFLDHSSLRAIQLINVTPRVVLFATVERNNR